ncbi:MAG: 2Fe-2S iron-sulfur cluster binding domain-containing protein [Gammaproteobacteria bacterium]|nr:2Fe-2S iron-sulfur cluster binding domain-containing protein [Gammaproteobacteria bacterium]
MRAGFRIELASGEAFTCAPGDTVLGAGLRHGLGLAYECNAGACGSCKLELLAGTVHEVYPDAPGLRPKEREKGKRLACQCVPLEDLRIKMRTGADYVPAIPPSRRTARLVARRAVTHDLMELTFETDDAARFLPGQYALLHLAAPIATRAYSMSNVPGAAGEGRWQFIVRRVPGGLVSARLCDEFTPGATLELDAPYGIAHYRAGVMRPIVCVAGGSGLAPMLAIVRELAARAEAPPAFLFYGGRSARDVPDLAAEIGAADPARTAISAVVSMPGLASEEHPLTLPAGLVHEHLARSLPGAFAAYEYYLAGPPPMIEACVRMLVADHGVPPTQIHFDRFF